MKLIGKLNNKTGFYARLCSSKGTEQFVEKYSKILWVSGKSYPAGVLVAVADSGYYGGQNYRLYFCKEKHISVDFETDKDKGMWEAFTVGYSMNAMIAETAKRATFDDRGESITGTYLNLNNVTETIADGEPGHVPTVNAVRNYVVNNYHTKDEVSESIKSAVSSVYKYKGTYDWRMLDRMPTEYRSVGDVWNISVRDDEKSIATITGIDDEQIPVSNGDNAVWTGNGWDKLAGTVDVSALSKKAEIWQPNTLYKVGTPVFANIKYEETYISAVLVCKKEHTSPDVNYPEEAEDFEECWTVWKINSERAVKDGEGNIIHDTYVPKNELESIRKLKPLKTITLKEDVASLDVDFDKPLDDIAILFDGTFAVAENKPIGVRTDSGGWYMFYVSGAMKTDTRQLFYAHAREISERYWEEIISGSFFFTLQGISASTTTSKLIVSKRSESISRYVEKLNILFPGRTEGQAIKAGSTITIWGHEANEEI